MGPSKQRDGDRITRLDLKALAKLDRGEHFEKRGLCLVLAIHDADGAVSENDWTAVAMPAGEGRIKADAASKPKVERAGMQANVEVLSKERREGVRMAPRSATVNIRLPLATVREMPYLNQVSGSRLLVEMLSSASILLPS